MISAVECREHAVECRQMSERAPSPRVRDILIDLARSWKGLRSKLSIARRRAPTLCYAINFEGSCRRRTVPSRMDRGGSEKKVADAGRRCGTDRSRLSAFSSGLQQVYLDPLTICASEAQAAPHGTTLQ